METRDVVGFVLVPLVMLLAVLLADLRPFGELAVDPTVLWFLRTVAYALLTVGGTALLCQTPPAQVRLGTVLAVWLGSLIAMTGKLLWDLHVPGDSHHGARWDPDLPLRLPDLIGFNAILLAAFLIARPGRPRWRPVGLGPAPGPERRDDLSRP